MILGIRTDKPESELWLADAAGKLVEVYKWQAHRQLAETIHLEMRNLLSRHESDLQSLTGIVGFLGPGSFTGLRIGLSVANALAYGLGIPIAGREDDHWFEKGVVDLGNEPREPLTPNYGAPVHITEQKK